MQVLIPAHPWSLYMTLFTLDPMWTLQKIYEGQHRASQSSIPRGVFTVCHWAGGRQSALCGTFSISLLSEVCSSRAGIGTPFLLSSHDCTKRSALHRSDEKNTEFWWRTCEHPVCIVLQVQRDALHLVCTFLLLLVLHISSTLAGIGFSQDQRSPGSSEMALAFLS